MHPLVQKELDRIPVNPPKINIEVSNSSKMAIVTVELPEGNDWWWGHPAFDGHKFKVFLTFQRSNQGLYSLSYRYRTGRISEPEEFSRLADAVDRVNELLLPYIL